MTRWYSSHPAADTYGPTGWCTMIMRTPLSRACRAASIALVRSCPTPARMPAWLSPAAATADSVARRASAAVSA